jgi:predicted nucleic acid-binding protein
MCRIYCDTCVYIDLFEGRKDKFRDLGEFALSVFRQVRDKKYKLIISDWLLHELEKQDHHNNFKNLIKSFETENLIKVELSSEDKREARKLSKTNLPDAKHVVLAKKANAIYLVTRNVQDFAEFREVIEIILPESL